MGQYSQEHDDENDDDNVVFSLDLSRNNNDSDSDVNEEERNDVFNLTFWGQIKWHWNHHKKT